MENVSDASAVAVFLGGRHIRQILLIDPFALRQARRTRRQ
jgi:hypothetical protein